MKEVYFIWRNLCATYNLETKQFLFDHHNLYIVPWQDYPEDMFKFIEWIRVCQEHKDDVVYTSVATGEKRYPEPKTIELY